MRFLPVGADALLVEVDDTAAATALYDEALRRHVAAVDVVPAARTVLFAGVHDVAALEREVAGWSVTPRPAAGRRNWRCPEDLARRRARPVSPGPSGRDVPV